eukprot:CAMPEP_0174375072 /NCGR_PEP_ID=MMETSP0811_2-20130205/113199_1 /TAXON_ID=73025 ORGANISM="Eutreptiella gymnastica-like, Strain CCMP1594" /NCGR_SAMPLE_ID=MMETSP0811_2 /ASSEMBLY_ACC=CAM_ASM_000667 /LENGTH=78 /DNA_ID=CAMNT_0015524943 /DNA_START=185 /DNA_END=421 /DNA_ORIENTATION=-
MPPFASPVPPKGGCVVRGHRTTGLDQYWSATDMFLEAHHPAPVVANAVHLESNGNLLRTNFAWKSGVRGSSARAGYVC